MKIEIMFYKYFQYKCQDIILFIHRIKIDSKNNILSYQNTVK